MRHKKVERAAVFGIVGNIFLIIIKAIIAIITHSQAMISDAFNSAGDILSSFMTFIGNKIASKEADEDHNLGHGKAEYIFTMLISLTMIIVAVKLLFSSIQTLFIEYNYKFSYGLLVVGLITFIVKISLYFYTHKIAKEENNLLIEANAVDHRNDCILTIMTTIAAIFGMYGITYVDGLVGSLVSIYMGLTGIKLFKESFDVLMDKGMSVEERNEVLEIIKKYDEVKKIQHFNSTPIGYQYQISFSIFVDGNLSTFDSHEIAHKLEKEITNTLDEVFVTIIHVNPIEIKKEEN